ncbi:S4 RNA-binding domain-containing protein [Citrus sinensis]|nr:S4 RNA-binding domain-containing protein [Citrus sinensis]
MEKRRWPQGSHDIAAVPRHRPRRLQEKLVNILKQMDPRDPFRIEMTDMLLEKLYNMGVIPSRKSLALCDHLSVSSFCRRRLATILVRLKFAEHLKEAVTYIEQGHIRVGPETVTDPAFLVTRNMEDFITWVDTSKIKRKVLEYNDKVDDYDAMN